MGASERPGYEDSVEVLRSSRAETLVSIAAINGDAIDRLVSGEATPEEIERFRSTVAGRVAQDYN